MVLIAYYPSLDQKLMDIMREERKECLLCDDECESISHALWECPVYSILRNYFK